MLALVEQHFDLFDRFANRFATGTTGGLLNELAIRIKGKDAGRNWVKPLLSGPLGGDAQIAELILDRQCRRMLFLEDPHVARQHEADIQLLERAARTFTDYASCVTDLKFAQRCRQRRIAGTVDDERAIRMCNDTPRTLEYDDGLQFFCQRRCRLQTVSLNYFCAAGEQTCRLQWMRRHQCRCAPRRQPGLQSWLGCQQIERVSIEHQGL
jgi:methylglyoxal synthase